MPLIHKRWKTFNDLYTKKQRWYNIYQIRSKNTKPEMIVRSLVHRMGYRYSLHRKDLSGTPDLVLVKHKKVIFVHGCFWHMHRCKYGRVIPKTNKKFWENKRNGNVQRSNKNIRALRRIGWKVLVVWECWARDVTKLEKRLRDFLKA